MSGEEKAGTENAGAGAGGFDINREIEIKLPGPEGEKIITVGFPNDDQWTEWRQRRPIIIRSVGRGKTETTSPEGSEEIDAALIAAIRKDEGPEIDEFDAALALDLISEAEVEGVERAAEGYLVFLRVPGMSTEHLLRIPSGKEKIKFRRKWARIFDLKYNKQEMVLNLAAAGELYDALRIEVKGYAGQVPIIHKSAVVQAALDAGEAKIGERTENF